MQITIIVAADLNNAIGRNNQLLWHLPQDMRFFKNVTWALPIVMGRKTFESMGKPLPGRTNIVISSNENLQIPGAAKAANIADALEKANALQTREVFIIGGGTIYAETLPLAQRVYLTRVHASIPDADTWFPPLNPQEWKLISSRPFKADEKHAFDYDFQCWDRIS